MLYKHPRSVSCCLSVLWTFKKSFLFFTGLCNVVRNVFLSQDHLKLHQGFLCVYGVVCFKHLYVLTCSGFALLKWAMWHRVYLVVYSVLSWLSQSCPERSLCSVCLDILTFSRTTSPCLLLCISTPSFSSYPEICLSCLSNILLYLMRLCSPYCSVPSPSLLLFIWLSWVSVVTRDLWSSLHHMSLPLQSVNS